jgi:SnoaL-like protein
MKRGGSAYVALVFAILFGYFAYQWWFNPSRAVKRRMGEIAATLSMPAQESQVATVGRLARLRGYLADDVRVRGGALGRELTSRNEALAIAASWRPSPNGWDVHFADLTINLEADHTARVYLTVEVTTPDPQGHPMVDTRDAVVALALKDGEWVVTDAEAREPARQP